LAFLVVRSYFKYREIQVKIEKIIIENAIDRATSKLLPLHKKTVKKK
jgi:hypothetical protein